MAKAATKKKPAKKKVASKPPKEPDALAPTGKAQRMLVSDAFPERDQHVEELIVDYLQAEAAFETAAQKAQDRYAAAQKVLKEAVRELGVGSYSSYDGEFVVELKPQDDRLKVRKRKKKEASPTAAVSDDGAGEEEAED